MRDLMIPRVIVTNPFPNMGKLNVGDILEAIPYKDKPNDYYEKSGTFVSVESAHKCTANFRSLSWWEFIDESEMPEYVKHENGMIYRHEYKKANGIMYFNQWCGSHQIGWLIVDNYFNNYQPSTNTSYINSKNQ